MKKEIKWNESGFRPPLCTYGLNWARRTSSGWWDDPVLQIQDSKLEPWRSEAEHATSRSRRLPTILSFTLWMERNIFVSFKPPRPGTEPRTLAWKVAVLTTTLGPPPWWKRKALKVMEQSLKHMWYLTGSQWRKYNKKNYVMNNIKTKLPRNALCALYKSYIAACHCDIIFDNCTIRAALAFENVQRRAALACKLQVHIKHTSTDRLLLEPNWIPLRQRRTNHKLVMLYKIIHWLDPSNLTTRPRYAGYRLRSFDNMSLPTPSARLSCVRNSYLNSSIKSWNSLDKIHPRIIFLLNLKSSDVISATHISTLYYIDVFLTRLLLTTPACDWD